MFADGPRARTWGNFDLLWRVGDLSWPADVLDNPAIWFIGSYRLYLGLRFTSPLLHSVWRKSGRLVVTIMVLLHFCPAFGSKPTERGPETQRAW